MHFDTAASFSAKTFHYLLTALILSAFTFQIFAPPEISAQETRELKRESSKVATEKRTALIIGNSAYSTSPLTNPANDANDMAATLKSLDFEVISGVNQSRAEMIRTVRHFGERLKANGGVGLFYYAGHGVQVAGRNYLIPVDASIRSENEVELEAMDVARVLVEMENAGNELNIVILDACRNNPFSRSWRSTNDGLAQINAPTGTLIAYSTAPGRVASDGTGRNAPYTAALLKVLKIPDLSLSDVFMQVRAEVQRMTNRQQIPWEASSIVGKFYFKQSQIPTLTKNEPEPLIAAKTKVHQEQEAWDLVKNSTDTEDFRLFLREFPNGANAAKAKIRLEELVWTLVKMSTDKAKVQAYLNEFPMGSNASAARIRLRQLENSMISNNESLAIGNKSNSEVAFNKNPIREKGIELFNKEDFNGAISNLREIVGKDKNDADVWYYLGWALAFTQDLKQSKKAFENMAKLKPNDARPSVGLSYVALLSDKKEETEKHAKKAIALNPQETQPYYFLGIVDLRQGDYKGAQRWAKRAITINPNYAPPYWVKILALFNESIGDKGLLEIPVSERAKIYNDALNILKSFPKSEANSRESDFIEKKLLILKMFAKYFDETRASAEQPKPLDPDESDSLTILDLPKAPYTDAARKANVSGVVQLAVLFGENGKIDYVLLLRGLGYGLNEEAVKTAYNIKFLPLLRNGIKIPVVKRIETTFSI